jgi:hypothetical protein
MLPKRKGNPILRNLTEETEMTGIFVTKWVTAVGYRCSWEGNIKMDIKGVACDGVYWSQVA